MVIVVEGKNDKNKILSVFKDAFVILTNGSAIDKNTLDLIKEMEKRDQVILCLDPDGPGEKIRKKILDYVPTCKSVFAIKAKAISKNHRKVGIEHMNQEDIVTLFENVYDACNKGNIKFLELYELGIMDSKIKREEICLKLHMGYCNAKQFLKRVNMFNISINEIRKIYDSK